MSALTQTLNLGLMGALWPSARAFEAATHQPERAQAARLRAVLAAVRGSQQARELSGLERVRDARDFQNAVPLSDAASLQGAFRELAEGRLTTLTGAPPVRFELSGGSTGAHKPLPMTPGLLDEFQRGLAPWLFDLLQKRPALRRGAAYWSISPIGAGRAKTLGGIPVGSESDSSYLPAMLRPLVEQVLAVPGSLARLPDVPTCRYVTLRCLLAREDLALVSIWNPSFFTLMLEQLELDADRLLADLEAGRCRPPPPNDAGPEWEQRVREICGERRWSIAPHAAARLRRAMRLPAAERVRILWPRLALLSCWGDAEARRSLISLERLLGAVEIQPKGLLATEGVLTIPRFGAPAPVLALRSHFYEFLPDDAGPEARPLLAYELEVGRSYQVLLSTSAGLLRYRLGDRVRVEGHFNRAPCLRLLGRADQVVDLVGEKLSLAHVGRVLDHEVGALTPGAIRFAMLAPEWTPAPGYCLFVEGALPDEVLQQLAVTVERRLAEGHTYAYARALGQLRPVEAVRVHGAMARYEARCVQLGQRAGDIKPVGLHRVSGWREYFADGATVSLSASLRRLPPASEATPPPASTRPADPAPAPAASTLAEPT